MQPFQVEDRLLDFRLLTCCKHPSQKREESRDQDAWSEWVLVFFFKRQITVFLWQEEEKVFKRFLTKSGI